MGSSQFLSVLELFPVWRFHPRLGLARHCRRTEVGVGTLGLWKFREQMRGRVVSSRELRPRSENLDSSLGSFAQSCEILHLSLYLSEP